MGNTRRRNVRPVPQMRSRTTRSKGKALVGDPTQNTQILTEQLRGLGLYAADTLGDGNCLFRALSDQLYGTPTHHLRLRQEICDWIESHSQRYAPFVEDERGIDYHLACMRQQATYGGHLELSAFAHMMKRDVKVIQPGLVYVIEWSAGGDMAESTGRSSPPPTGGDDREKRRLRREKRRSVAELEAPADVTQGPVYVAYHDWEHFSSIRNLRGPHTGLPNVSEAPAPDAAPYTPSVPLKKKPMSKAQESIAAKRLAKKTAAMTADAEGTRTPSQIPLPGSRSPSPSLSSAPSSQEAPNSMLSVDSIPRTYRSPKRTFDESSASSQAHSESSESAAKRAKSSSRAQSVSRNDTVKGTAAIPIEDLDTPELSASSSSDESVSSLSSVPSPEPTPPPEPRRLSQRERKQLGLPKPRAPINTRKRGGAGKIVIPGGRHKAATKAAVAPADESDAEWRKNGTGRVDVRGFRELKI